MPSTNDSAQSEGGLIAALHAPGPTREHADKLMLLGQFVGSWNLQWTGTGPDGRTATMTGGSPSSPAAPTRSPCVLSPRPPGHVLNSRPGWSVPGAIIRSTWPGRP